MVTMYTKKTCGYCHMAKQLLMSKEIDFNEIDVTHDIDKYTEMMQKADGRRTVPQIFIQDEAIGGFMELLSLSRSGTLDSLLKT